MTPLTCARLRKASQDHLSRRSCASTTRRTTCNGAKLRKGIKGSGSKSKRTKAATALRSPRAEDRRIVEEAKGTTRLVTSTGVAPKEDKATDSSQHDNASLRVIPTPWIPRQLCGRQIPRRKRRSTAKPGDASNVANKAT